MKKLFLFGFSVVALFSACQKSGDDVATPPTSSTWPAGTGEYAPYTLGSTFVFEIASGTPTVIDSFTYTVTKDTTINSLPFKKLESNKPLLGVTYYSNYNAGVVTNITYNLNFQGLVTVPVITQTILKDNLPVGGTWSEVLNLTVPGVPIPIAVTFAYTIVQKDFVKNILGKDYVSTIAAKQVASLPAVIIPFLPAGSPSSFQIDNYFAKGVGLVEKDATGNILKIKRYNVVR
jgi:hypothetical protein